MNSVLYALNQYELGYDKNNFISMECNYYYKQCHIVKPIYINCGQNVSQQICYETIGENCDMSEVRWIIKENMLN